MIKIAFIIPNYDSGGMGKVLETLSLGLDDNEYEQYLIILLKGRKINFKTKAEIIEINNEGKSVYSKSIVFLRRIISVRKIKKKCRFDIVLSFGSTANIINIMSNCKEKLIVSEHSIKSTENKENGLLYQKIFNFLIRNLYNRSDKVITVSKLMKNDLVLNYGVKKDKIVTIYNGINIRRINLESRKEEVTEFSDFYPILSSVGSLCRNKGQDHLVRILPVLLTTFPNVKLLLIGTGEMKKELENLAKRLNVDKSVAFIGHVKNPYKYMRISDLFILTSFREGLPMVLCEAMALSLPIIATDCISGPREMLQKEPCFGEKLRESEYVDYGVLVPTFEDNERLNSGLTRSEQTMANAIIRMLRNKSIIECYRKRSYRRVSFFSDKIMINNYKNLFYLLK